MNSLFPVVSCQIPKVTDRLTARQIQVVAQVISGRSDKEIALLLSISLRTVRAHIYNACRRLELESRTQLIVVFVVFAVEEAIPRLKKGFKEKRGTLKLSDNGGRKRLSA